MNHCSRKQWLPKRNPALTGHVNGSNGWMDGDHHSLIQPGTRIGLNNLPEHGWTRTEYSLPDWQRLVRWQEHSTVQGNNNVIIITVVDRKWIKYNGTETYDRVKTFDLLNQKDRFRIFRMYQYSIDLYSDFLLSETGCLKKRFVHLFSHKLNVCSSYGDCKMCFQADRANKKNHDCFTCWLFLNVFVACCLR